MDELGPDELTAVVAGLRLVDHHVHGAAKDDLDESGFELGLTESPWPAPAGTSHLDSQVGFAVRCFCAPLLDLPPHPAPADYLRRRRELGTAEVTRRFLTASGVGWMLIDSGYDTERTLGVAEMAAASGARTAHVVRLESVAEEVAASGTGAGEFADRFAAALAEQVTATRAVGLKSVIAYRYGGLDFEPRPPAPDEVRRAAGQWLRRCEQQAEQGTQGAQGTAGSRLDHPVLLRHLLWAGVEHRLPLQFHTGYGDPDLTLHRCDPALMTGFLRLVQDRDVPVMLLHCYPYHRGAGYLAQVFPHVYLDVGLAVNYTAARAAAVVAESLELAPFGKVLFSSDAWGPPELHYLGALLWRRAVTEVLGAWVRSGQWSAPDAIRVATMMGAGNARRVYRLEERDGRGSSGS